MSEKLKKLKAVGFRAQVYICTILLSLILISINPINLSVLGEATRFSSINNNLAVFLEDINLSNIMNHMQKFSSIPTRVTGYPGCEQASEYIIEYFRKLGLKIEVQDFPVLVPIDHGANITVPSTGEIFEAYPLWPNLIQCSPTPPEGISGHLIYAGSGSLKEFDGLEVNGSIVLMDFNSLDNWINAAKLGAKAIIFIEPWETTRMEAESKVILTPIYFPRVYVSREVGERLKVLAEENATITLRSNMRFEWRTGKNIIGVLNGERDDQIVILAAHYDSWSPVPSKAPDAFDAIQISTLLEIARIFSARKPYRTVWFLALSGHYESIAGAREFIEKYYFQNETYRTGQKKIIAFADLNLATDSQVITWVSPLRTQNIESQGELDFLFNKRYFPALSKLLNLNIENYVIAPHLRGDFELSYFNPSLDSEPASCSGGLGITYLTIRTLRTYFMTPINQIDKVDLSDFEIQLKFVLYTFAGLANDDLSEFHDLHWRPPYREYSPPAGGGGSGAGVVTLTGQVVKYNYLKGFYEPIPNAFVVIHRYDGGIASNIQARERHHPIWSCIITKADENGSFTVHTLESYRCYAYIFNVLAFVIDQDTGEILYAPDFGIYGGGGGVLGGYRFLGVVLDRHPYYVKTVVFKCKSLTLFDIFDPYAILRPRKNINRMGDLQTGLPSIEVNEFISHTRPMSWGMISPQDTGEPLAMIFTEPKTTLEIILYSYIGRARTPVGIINGANETNPMGTGIRQVGAIPLTILKYLEGLSMITGFRYSTLQSYHVIDPLAFEWHQKSCKLLAEAREALSKFQYSQAYKLLYNAWNMEVNAYSRITGISSDVVNTSVAFYLILFPFAFALEALLFSRRGKTRLLTIFITFLIFIALAYFIHPGFRLASNFWGSFLGLSVIASALVVIAVVALQAASLGKRLRTILSGLHYAELSRSGAFLYAFSVGIQNIRKRKLRSVLTLISLILFTSSFVALTSVLSFTFVHYQIIPCENPYNGMLITRPNRQWPLTPEYISYFSSLLPEAKVIPRAWFFPRPMLRSVRPIPKGFVYSASGKCIIRAVVGLTVEEANLTHINTAIQEGRWFIPWDTYVCILPKALAGNLSVGIGDQIEFLGMKYKVIGIANEGQLKLIRDLDLSPLSPVFPQTGGRGVQTLPISWKDVIIMPYTTVRKVLDGLPYMIAVISDDEAALNSVAHRIVLGGGGQIEAVVGYNGKIAILRSGAGFTVSGFQFLTLPFVIATLVIFTTMLGSLYERTREIAIYSSLGLSPLHVAGLFLAESITYALIGGVFGYLSGVIGINILLLEGEFSSNLSFNLASSVVFITIGISFLATMAASIYPSLKAGRLVTPSLERRWKIPTKPVGDEWSIPLPFFSTTREEVKGIMVFIKEFLEIYQSPDVGVFWVREPINFEKIQKEDEEAYVLSTVVALPPWDARFVEEFKLIATKRKEKQFNFEVYLKYVGGERHPWKDSNPRFIDSIRKQLLLWRGLKQEERDSYIRKGRETLLEKARH